MTLPSPAGRLRCDIHATEETNDLLAGNFLSLERTYVTRIERYDGEQITYLGETIDGDQATVRTKILDKTNRELAVEYRMLRGRDGRWVIYDVLIEGVSLVAIYRSQFDQVIRTASYERLVAKLKSPSS